MSENRNQISAPYYLPSLVESAQRLDIAVNEDGKKKIHDEDFIRNLIFSAPEILPIEEIEPVFCGAKSICIELQNGSGFADNLLITEDGHIIIVECKLYRNPQARREVIAQILDYAAQLSKWRFEDLETAVLKSQLPSGAKPEGILEKFKNNNEFDEATFIDVINRNLSLGRMLLLIVGDGIRSDLVSLTELLQIHPGFQATLGLVEIRLFNCPTGGYFVQPRTLLKTENIVRGIVEIKDGNATINSYSLPKAELKQNISQKPSTLSEVELYEKIETNFAGMGEKLKEIVGDFSGLGVQARIVRTLSLRYFVGEIKIELANIWTSGECYLLDYGQTSFPKWLRDVFTAYLETVAESVGGQLKYWEKSNSKSVYKDGRPVRIATLIEHKDNWLKAASDLISTIKSHEES